MKTYKIIEISDEGIYEVGTGQCERLSLVTVEKMIIEAVISEGERADCQFLVADLACDDNERVARVVFDGNNVEYILVQE